MAQRYIYLSDATHKKKKYAPCLSCLGPNVMFPNWRNAACSDCPHLRFRRTTCYRRSVDSPSPRPLCRLQSTPAHHKAIRSESRLIKQMVRNEKEQVYNLDRGRCVGSPLDLSEVPASTQYKQRAQVCDWYRPALYGRGSQFGFRSNFGSLARK